MEGDECGYYVNEVDGLPNEHPALPEFDSDEPSSSAVDRDSFDDLPTSIIVTNIHSEVFVDEELKAEMESLFREFSKDVTFHWLKSFRRLRVNYTDAVSAGLCFVSTHEKINFTLKSFFSKRPNPAPPIQDQQIDNQLLFCATYYPSINQEPPATSPDEAVPHLSALQSSSGLGTSWRMRAHRSQRRPPRSALQPYSWGGLWTSCRCRVAAGNRRSYAENARRGRCGESEHASRNYSHEVSWKGVNVFMWSNRYVYELSMSWTWKVRQSLYSSLEWSRHLNE